MGHRTNPILTLALAAAALSAGGCALVNDLDSFESGDGGVDGGVTCAFDSPEPRDLVLELQNFSPHVDELTEVRIVSSDDDPPFLRGRAILDPLEAPDVVVEMPGAIPAGPHRLDLFGDDSKDGMYQDPPEDHAWQLEPCTPRTVFEHNTLFDALPTPTPVGEDATIRFTGMPSDNSFFELRVMEQDSGRTVGLYRIPSQPDTDFTVTIPGIIDTGITYRVAFFSDGNDNQTYDAPPTDEAWEIRDLIGGVDEDFAHNTDYTDIQF